MTRVDDEFDRLVHDRSGHRFGFAAYRHGVLIVDRHTDHPARPAPMFLYSAGKPVAAIVVGMLAADGLIDFDTPVAQYWPEFAAAGKEALTVAEVLSHQAGLINVDGDEGFTLEEYLRPDVISARLAETTPRWPPGSAHGYHALTFGPLAEEIVARTVRRPLAELFVTTVAGPRGIEVDLGVDDDVERRLVPPHVGHPRFTGVNRDGPFAELAAAINIADGFPALLDVPTSPQVRAAGLTAIGAVGTPEGLARLWASTHQHVDGKVPVWPPAVLAEVTRPRTWGLDRVLGVSNAFAVGMQTSWAPTFPLLGPGSIGHDGVGGALGAAHPGRGVAVGFVSDHVPDPAGVDPAAPRLIDALLEDLEDLDRRPGR